MKSCFSINLIVDKNSKLYFYTMALTCIFAHKKMLKTEK
jgi:hypothetical protein